MNGKSFMRLKLKWLIRKSQYLFYLDAISFLSISLFTSSNSLSPNSLSNASTAHRIFSFLGSEAYLEFKLTLVGLLADSGTTFETLSLLFSSLAAEIGDLF